MSILSCVGIHTCLNHGLHVRSCVVIQRNQPLVKTCNHVRELSNLYITDVRCTGSCLKCGKKLCVHIGVRICRTCDLDRLIRMLLVPNLSHLAVMLSVKLYECPHLKMCSVRITKCVGNNI